MLLLSPGAGAIVALVGVTAIEVARKRSGVRRDYESIYSIGLAFAAYAAAEAMGGSGFVAAFAAGLTVSSLDAELCDCFLEYGETTAENGAAVHVRAVRHLDRVERPGRGHGHDGAVVTLLIRPVAYFPALIPARLSVKNRGLIAWFGPRGLSSLLLVMLAVFAGVEGSSFSAPGVLSACWCRWCCTASHRCC